MIWLFLMFFSVSSRNVNMGNYPWVYANPLIMGWIFTHLSQPWVLILKLIFMLGEYKRVMVYPWIFNYIYRFSPFLLNYIKFAKTFFFSSEVRTKNEFFRQNRKINFLTETKNEFSRRNRKIELFCRNQNRKTEFSRQNRKT